MTFDDKAVTGAPCNTERVTYSLSHYGEEYETTGNSAVFRSWQNRSSNGAGRTDDFKTRRVNGGVR